MRTTITSFLVLAVLACGGMEGCVAEADAATKLGPNNINTAVPYTWTAQHIFDTSGGTSYAVYLLANATKAHSHLQPLGGDPSSLSDGDLWITTTALKARVNGATYTLAPPAASEYNFSAYKTNFSANATPTIARSKCTNAATVTADSTVTVTQYTTGGAGNLVLKLCTDGVTCAGANTLLTCTVACTGTNGTVTACTVNNAACAAGTTVTWSYVSGCSAGNQDPQVNINAHFTVP